MNNNHIKNIRSGKVEKVDLKGTDLNLKLSNANAIISCYNENVFRIFLHPTQERPGHSYAVIENAIEFPNFTESEKRITIKTNKLQLNISKDAFNITFNTLKGEVINEDDTAFSTSWIGNEITTYKKLNDKERFIGLGEKTGPIDKRGNAYVNWNSDVFAYGVEADPLYATIPFYIGIKDGLFYGILFDNTYKTNFNFGASNKRFVSFGAEAGPMNYYFIYGVSISEIIQSLSKLTGKMSMPPKWSLGLQQCRYSYYPDSDLVRVAQTYRDKKIPCDVIYYDIHYMEDYKVFTWHPTYFPNPKQTNEQLAKLNFKKVVIVDPGVKKEKGYAPYEEGIKGNHFVNYPDGAPYSAEVWPGWCHFPDFTNEETRNWWATKFKKLKKDGIDGFWNDMNEPASWGQASPDLIEFDYDEEKSTHKGAHNVYGMQMARATKSGAEKANPNERPFILTRAAYAGIQRYAALWTGDNTASDEHMLLGNRMVANIGLCGVPFCGNDVGGFAGDTSSELFARWIQSAAFHPFFRLHKMVNSKPNEPWTYGEQVEAVAKNFIQLRYRLMPYIYSLFYQASINGLPICRSLVLNYPNDNNIYKTAFENQYMLGEALLICAVDSKTTIAKVYLPKGDWYLLYNDIHYKGGQIHLIECPIDIIPIFAKGGEILIEQSQTEYWNDEHDSILRIHLYKGSEKATLQFYEDDGISIENDKEVFAKRNIVFDANENKLIIEAQNGSFKSTYKKAIVYIHNEQVAIGESYRFIEPLPAFDPFFVPGSFDWEIKNVKQIELNLSADKIELSL